MSFANVVKQLGFGDSVILIIYPFGWITVEIRPRNPVFAFVQLSSMRVGACIKGSINGFKIILVIQLYELKYLLSSYLAYLLERVQKARLMPF